MGRYIVRRLLMMIPVLIGTTFFIYAMAWAIPGDPFASRCGQRPCTDAFIQAETERLHLDEALPIQYLHFLWNMLQGDFGTTSTGSTVLEEASAAFPITVKLTVVAILFEIFLGIGSGSRRPCARAATSTDSSCSPALWPFLFRPSSSATCCSTCWASRPACSA